MYIVHKEGWEEEEKKPQQMKDIHWKLIELINIQEKNSVKYSGKFKNNHI